MTEFSMVYYNNLLSIGPVLLLMALFGEFQVRGWLRCMGAFLIPPSPTTVASCRLMAPALNLGSRAALMGAAHSPHLTHPGPIMHGGRPLCGADEPFPLLLPCPRSCPGRAHFRALSFRLWRCWGACLDSESALPAFGERCTEAHCRSCKASLLSVG